MDERIAQQWYQLATAICLERRVREARLDSKLVWIFPETTPFCYRLVSLLGHPVTYANVTEGYLAHRVAGTSDAAGF